MALTPLSVGAIPIEAGITMNGAHRYDDRLSSGIRNFRTSPDPYQTHLLASEVPHLYSGAELYLRGLDIAGPGHSFGIAFGTYDYPEFKVREIRSDGITNDLSMKFWGDYFIFTYHYRPYVPPFRFARGLGWEAGIGIGFIPEPRLHLDGYTTDSLYLVSPYMGRLYGNIGSITRLETSLTYTQGNLIYRGGIRASYIMAGGFRGKINGSDGSLFYLENGNIFPVTAYLWDFLTAMNNFSFPGNGAQNFIALSAIRERVNWTSGNAELLFSIGYRFGR
jgi:hypothetical protein